MSDLPTLQIIAIITGLAGTSVLAGILAGLLGVGGGIVLVPVLFWLLSATDFPPELSMHMAVATSLATIIFTSISSARAHNKRGSVDTALLRLWAPGIALGALTGGLAAKYIDADGLKLVFGSIAVLVAINMALPKTLVISDHMPRNRAVNAAISYGTGVFSALMGIGGGTLSVPLLSAFSVEIRRAVGTASAFGFLIAVPAAAGFIYSGLGVEGRPPLSLGYVNLLGAVIILPFTVGFAPVGAKLAHTLETKWIKRAFALFLGITAVRMLMSALG
ncbi:putative membrane protein YfcA [Aliiruegeria haliotis]|uniref:Probable membrane transporter protein n=1 Tax=Aliiruegeria haliotis TaxID=1280846 RepID=A0A2T0RW22_9RHOB|nr:sulfite exporter TauE/SafE family protein [Aliiruegeria haliotis]PRY25395.1 putative membrane protein YfcA [Aliiruegeria haliotis]